MSKNEKDYSDYIQHMSNLMGGLYLIVGFVFTVITLLVTQLPDPNNIASQLTLFFLTCTLDLTLFLGGMHTVDGIYNCQNVPPLTKRTKISNLLVFLVFDMVGFSVVLMFLLWNLVYLALASAIAWALFIIAAYLFIWKPFQEYRIKSRRGD